ncbi:hypothetical protein AYI69_g2670 [Smittium culicis]|uniref:Uncharacterized protein n=1 Tax=Smittium culicis TaxID=133412 RepID=A0A1R1YLR3_9FUNG|nr:hypothetical protein AYI69_g2670 [Smittium culicis]
MSFNLSKNKIFRLSSRLGSLASSQTYPAIYRNPIISFSRNHYQESNTPYKNASKFEGLNCGKNSDSCIHDSKIVCPDELKRCWLCKSEHNKSNLFCENSECKVIQPVDSSNNYFDVLAK